MLHSTASATIQLVTRTTTFWEAFSRSGGWGGSLVNTDLHTGRRRCHDSILSQLTSSFSFWESCCGLWRNTRWWKRPKLSHSFKIPNYFSNFCHLIVAAAQPSDHNFVNTFQSSQYTRNNFFLLHSFDTISLVFTIASSFTLLKKRGCQGTPRTTVATKRGKYTQGIFSWWNDN